MVTQNMDSVYQVKFYSSRDWRQIAITPGHLRNILRLDIPYLRLPQFGSTDRTELWLVVRFEVRNRHNREP